MMGDGALADLMRYLTVCGQVWLTGYLACCLVYSLTTAPTLHLMCVGLLVCVLAALRLPAPDRAAARAVLGSLHCDRQPTVPSTELTVAHRAAGLDAPENSLEAVRLAASNGAKEKSTKIDAKGGEKQPFGK